ncbi:hypothetical protein [Deefgea salmonis]|uniref:Uncharacterized protein n=1 Tax=Deefgea salmonis TaxID=2875502 RepID=A0ABS8BLQ7_9NEIS|nr:hypothetical protein [Deefgea salmonis]MCB5196552.1 hypothetical protein [Deefgea salmonis]
MKRIVLLLTPTHTAALCASNQGVRPLAHFNHDAAGRASLAQFSLAQQHGLFYVLTDLGEEDFQQEVIPHLTRQDQQRLIARKLEQRYRGTTYRYGRVLQQAGQQDQLQLSALLNEAPLDALISTLLTANCAIAGVYSVALLTENLLKKLRLDRPHLLIMSRSTPETLRQSYFVDSTLQFSRLGHLDVTPNLLAQAQGIIEQAHRARQYLTTMRVLARDEVLPVWALFDVSMSQALRQIAANSDVGGDELTLDLQVDLAFLQQKLQLPSGGLSWLDVLLAALLQLNVPNQYAPPAVLRLARSRQLARRIKFCAFAIVALAAILLGLALWQGQKIQAQWPSLQQQIEHETQQLAALQPLSQRIDPVHMQAAVQLYQRDLANWPSATEAAQRFSQVLTPFSQLQLINFQWQTGTAGLLASTDPTLPLRAQQIKVTLRASPLATEQQAWQQIEQLLAQLQRWPNAKVALMPSPTEARTSASADDAAESAAPWPMDFVLQLTLANPPPEAQ